MKESPNKTFLHCSRQGLPEGALVNYQTSQVYLITNKNQHNSSENYINNGTHHHRDFNEIVRNLYIDFQNKNDIHPNNFVVSSILPIMTKL